MPTLCMLYVSRPVLNQKSVMVLSTYAKQRIITLHGQGYRSPTITKLLKEEGLRASRVAVRALRQRSIVCNEINVPCSIVLSSFSILSFTSLRIPGVIFDGRPDPSRRLIVLVAWYFLKNLCMYIIKIYF